jgi:hypothetical protein
LPRFSSWSDHVAAVVIVRGIAGPVHPRCSVRTTPAPRQTTLKRNPPCPCVLLPQTNAQGPLGSHVPAPRVVCRGPV